MALLGIEGPGTHQPSSGFLEPIPVISVSSSGYPTYAPSYTADERATKVRRDDLPTTITNIRTIKYEILDENLPKKCQNSTRRQWIRFKIEFVNFLSPLSTSLALLRPSPEDIIFLNANSTSKFAEYVKSFIGIKYPRHYITVAGWVEVSEREEEIRDNRDKDRPREPLESAKPFVCTGMLFIMTLGPSKSSRATTRIFI